MSEKHPPEKHPHAEPAPHKAPKPEEDPSKPFREEGLHPKEQPKEEVEK